MRVPAIVLLTACAISSQAQHVHDPYADQTGQPFPLVVPLVCSNCTGYEGEYQIFLDEYRWQPTFYAYAKIEAVSFPFTPKPEIPDINVREMVMPDLDSYGFNADGDICQGWAWNSTNVGDQQAPQRDLMREAIVDFEGNNAGGSFYMTDHCMLISKAWNDVTGPPHDCSVPLQRTFLPHTILKHTVYFVNNQQQKVDSISWVYDHTRGRMRNYPFCWDCGTLPAAYDVCFRPYAIADPGGHDYAATSNATWTGTVGVPYGTPNYFKAPYDQAGWNIEVWPDQPTQPFYTTWVAAAPTRQAPYSLLEVPLLNNASTAYAGYHITGQNQQPIFYNDPAFDFPWTFTIDKPIDLRLINPNEKIIYNPSEAVIDIDGNLYPDKTLVFPSGYTFRTVHGVHPSEADVLANDPAGITRILPWPWQARWAPTARSTGSRAVQRWRSNRA